MSAQRVIIPMYHGVKGDLKQFFYSRDGNLKLTEVFWLVPVAVFTPDGLNVFEFKTIPTTARYENNLTFEVWDKLRNSTPKLVATVKIDTIADTYVVEVSERYMKNRFTMEFNLIIANREPDPALLYRNNTHHGDIHYKGKL
ncbi:hypothetical protein [Pseudomonas phage PA1C]|nr:hypothetical protein [Pseudomonas phage PA1C]BEG72507.1 hypothetical protein RVBP21_1350 [Pseudomonas phage BRkr]